MNCDCHRKVNERLREQGMKLSDKHFMFEVTEDLSMETTMGLLLERVDGQRMKRSDPKILQMTYCPICGQKLKKEKQNENQT